MYVLNSYLRVYFCVVRKTYILCHVHWFNNNSHNYPPCLSISCHMSCISPFPSSHVYFSPSIASWPRESLSPLSSSLLVSHHTSLCCSSLQKCTRAAQIAVCPACNFFTRNVDVLKKLCVTANNIRFLWSKAKRKKEKSIPITHNFFKTSTIRVKNCTLE